MPRSAEPRRVRRVFPGAPMIPRILFLVSTLAFVSAPLARAEQPNNELTAAEKKAGWKLLFDGKTFNGWKPFHGKPMVGWEVQNGTLHVVPKVKGSELVTDQKFDNFEFSWEWKLPPRGNNGVKYFVSDERPGAPGHEYQMLDDKRHPDATHGPLRQTAAFYYVLPPAADKPYREAGEWNQSKIVVRGNTVEHWLNGQKVLTYEAGSDVVKAGVAASKFAKVVPRFGEKIVGPLMLTYHEDECWYRNLKVREL
jgi:hypothetical protein